MFLKNVWLKGRFGESCGEKSVFKRRFNEMFDEKDGLVGGLKRDLI